MLRTIIATVLNLPWNLGGLLFGLASFPKKLSLQSGALVLGVKSLWWAKVLPNYKSVRAVTIGQMVLIGPNAKPQDLSHELIHVEQVIRSPFIQPVLYVIETLRYGYKYNKYEKEAYARQDSL